MLRYLADGLRGNEDTDGEVRRWRQLQVDGIADHERSRRDGDRRPSIESERARSGGVDLAAPGAERDVGCSDGQRVAAEFVGQDDADGGAADRDVDDLAEGGVGAADLGIRI